MKQINLKVEDCLYAKLEKVSKEDHRTITNYISKIVSEKVEQDLTLTQLLSQIRELDKKSLENALHNTKKDLEIVKTHISNGDTNPNLRKLRLSLRLRIDLIEDEIRRK